MTKGIILLNDRGCQGRDRWGECYTCPQTWSGELRFEQGHRIRHRSLPSLWVLSCLLETIEPGAGPAIARPSCPVVVPAVVPGNPDPETGKGLPYRSPAASGSGNLRPCGHPDRNQLVDLCLGGGCRLHR